MVKPTRIIQHYGLSLPSLVMLALLASVLLRGHLSAGRLAASLVIWAVIAVEVVVRIRTRRDRPPRGTM